MSDPPLFRESIFNYYIGIPFIIILSLLLVPIIATGGSIGLVIPFVIIGFIFINTFKLDICIVNKELQLSLGMGWLKKSIQISDLELTEFKEKSIPWYLKGTLFKYDFQGNLIFCPKAGEALILQYKTGKQCLFIVSGDNRKLFEKLKR